jgi:hypothetical protein
MSRRHDADELDRAAATIQSWAEGELRDNPMVLAVDHDPAERRWYVRLQGEEKEVTTVWLTLRERTLHHEAYVLPAPEEDHARFYEYLLRTNRRLYGMAFEIGPEDAIYLRGQLALDWLDAGELDRIVGSTWQWSEDVFRTALGIGFASLLRPRSERPAEAGSP